MRKTKGITRTAGDGEDRIEWLDANDTPWRVRPTLPASVADIRPGKLARIPPKFKGQKNYHGHYYFASIDRMVFHESLNERTGLMLIEHLRGDVVDIAPQPLLITFANGRNHTPDYLVMLADGRRLLVDVHDEKDTSEADEELFELTRLMCMRVGWEYELIDGLDQVARWNLEWMNRYHHPRYEPTTDVRQLILTSLRGGAAFGTLLAALATDKPGEHVPALAHLMWKREVVFDTTAPFTDQTKLRPRA